MIRYFLAFYLIAKLNAQTCPPGGIYNAMYKKCYQFYAEPAQFAYAEQLCNQEHGHLVSIASAFENNLVNVNAEVSFDNKTNNYWVGLNDLLNPGKWGWIDGANLTYDNWAPTQPRQGSDCGMVQISEGKWYSTDCMTFLPYVCAVPVIYPPTCPPQTTPTPLTCPTYPACTVNYCFPQCDVEWTYFWPTGMCYKDENTFVNYIARTGEKQDPKDHLTWIGLKYNKSQSEFYWSDGSKFDYSNWSPENPMDMDTEQCVLTASDYTHHVIFWEKDWYETWETEKCDTVMRSFVCKKSPIL